ncbi:hypothetical protein LOTGIDRAFT_172073 [Lottia gigantea]|uniref:GLTSCR protein conserved domain-containing protein n=1 Tax=Lottia gigantea TaxID=225164 RepID=V4B4L5_LOTGI|nr:hypothetical protein LOTGIDRAFT_172073 [Lottia gigantea]ESP02416.1 hypothetical protein LOTGIDRAFT_172073 [Lottia gigantea]
MEDGLEVNIDEFFGEGSTSIPSFGDGEGFSWADDFISSAEGVFQDRSSASITTTTNVLPSSIAQVSQNHVPQSVSTTANVSQQQVRQTSTTVIGTGQQPMFVQQFPNVVNIPAGQGQVSNPAGLLQGCSFRHAKYRKKGFHSVPQFIIKSSSTGPTPPVQTIQTQPSQPVQQLPRSSPAPAASPFSANSPLTSRSVTPSCSPAPAMSPLVSRSITPIQTPTSIVSANNLSRPPSHSGSPAPNFNMMQFNQNNNNLQSRAQVQIANSLPIQGLIPNPSPNTNSIMTGQSNLTPNIVHTQNAVIQNPNVVNLNVAHVLCNNSQNMGQQGVQTVPVTMQNPMNIQGTIIQTAQGKSILIPNNQLQGQQINLAGMQNIVQSNQVGQPIIQNQQNLGNVIRLAPQQDKPQTAQPNYSFVNLGGGQGQQILIQRAQVPGQPQNIILRSVQPNIIFQQPGQTAQAIQPQQIQQQIIGQPSGQNLQFQQVLAGGQQMKIVTPSGQLAQQPGAVTLNLAGQNLNLQQLANFNSNNLQGVQMGSSGQFIIQQPTQQQQQMQQSVQISSSVKTNTKVSSSVSSNQAIDPLTQALSLSGITENGSTFSDPSPTPTPTPPPVEVKKPSKSKSKKQAQQVTSVSSTSQPASQFPHILEKTSNIAGLDSGIGSLSTAQSTIVTTTISQSFVQTSNSLTMASTSLGGQVMSSVSQPTFIQSNQFQSSNLNQVVTLSQSGSTVVQQQQNVVIQQTTNTSQHLQRIETDIKRLMGLKSMTMEQKQQLQRLSMLKQKLMNSNQNQMKNSSVVQQQQILPMVGQPPIAQMTQSQTAPSPVVQVSPAVQQVTPVKHVLQPVQNLQSIDNSGFQLQSTNNAVQFSVAQPQLSSNLVTSNIPASKNLVQIQPAHGVAAPRPIMSTGTPVASAPTGKLPIPANATLAVPTQIKIGNQLLTLNLTPQQKDKLQLSLSKMTIEQQEQFLKHQSTLKLQQKQQQIQALQAAAAQQQVQKVNIVVGQSGSKIPLAVQQVSGTPIKSEVIGQQPQSTTPVAANRVKMVAPEIPKASLIHQQMSKDQQNAVAPDTKTPFKNSREACRRLLRYHVFQWSGPSQEEHDKAEHMMELRAQDLLNKSRSMMDKYRLLLLNDSMREKPSAEMVMIQRMLHQDLTACIKEDKRKVEEDPESFEPMPMKYLKSKDSKSDESFDEDKVVKKESSFEDESSVRDTSDESEPSIVVPDIKQEEPVFKNSPSSGTMKLLIRKHSQGFVSSLANEDSGSEKANSPLVSIKSEPVDCEYMESNNGGDSLISKTSSSVFRASLKTKIKLENSDVKNPLHIDISGEGTDSSDPHHDTSFQHSDESYEDYKDSVLISRDMTNMPHTDISDVSMVEDLDHSISPVIPSHRHSDESKTLNSMTINMGENLTQSLCNDQSGRDRGDIVDSVESATYSSESPAYQASLGLSGLHGEEESAMISDSYPSTIIQSNSDLNSIISTTETYTTSEHFTNSQTSQEFLSVNPNEIQSISQSSASYQRQISSTELSDFDQSEHDNFNTSFSSDNVADQPNALLSNQMQSAIDSILDNEEDTEDYIAGQSNSYNSQEVSEEEEEDEDSYSSSRGEEEHRKGNNSDEEDETDLDAAVNSILM